MWLGVFALLSQQLVAFPMLGVAASVLLLSLPAIAALWHRSAVNNTLGLYAYRSGALLHRFFQRRLLGMVVSAVGGLLLTALALAQAPFLDAGTWTLLLATAPLFALLQAAVHKAFAGQYSTEYYAQRALRRLVHLAVVVVLTGLWAALQMSDQAYQPHAVGERVAALQSSWAHAPSHALRWVLDGLAWGQAASEFALSSLPLQRWWQALAGLLLAPLALFAHASLTVAGSALPANEIRRATAARHVALAAVPPLTRMQTALWAAVLVLASWAWFGLAGGLEYAARSTPSAFAVQLVPDCERIGGAVYRVGTEALLNTLSERTDGQLAAVKASACAQLATVRAVAEPGVDAYLDWYFTLGAEWARLGAMLVGDAEALLSQKFTQLVLSDPAVAAAYDTVQSDYAAQLGAASSARAQALALLESQRLVVSESQCKPVIDVPVSPAVTRLEAHGLRAIAGPGAALTAGAATGAIVAKVMGKASMKAASKVMLKLAAKKGVGALGKALAGAAIGSVVPGVGTAIGASLGALAALTIGTGVDIAMLAAEEALSRDGMRRELLDAVDEALAPTRAVFACP